MDKIFLGAIGVFGIVIMRLVLLPQDSVLGTTIVVGSALTFMGLGSRYALNYTTPPAPDSDQGFDPEVVASARREDGLE